MAEKVEFKPTELFSSHDFALPAKPLIEPERLLTGNPAPLYAIFKLSGYLLFIATFSSKAATPE